jgi:hypothetical protein
MVGDPAASRPGPVEPVMGDPAAGGAQRRSGGGGRNRRGGDRSGLFPDPRPGGRGARRFPASDYPAGPRERAPGHVRRGAPGRDCGPGGDRR